MIKKKEEEEEAAKIRLLIKNQHDYCKQRPGPQPAEPFENVAYGTNMVQKTPI